MLSRTATYALRAVVSLAGLASGEYAGAGEVADQVGAPRNYLGKLLRTLADEGTGIAEGQGRIRSPAGRNGSPFSTSSSRSTTSAAGAGASSAAGGVPKTVLRRPQPLGWVRINT